MWAVMCRNGAHLLGRVGWGASVLPPPPAAAGFAAARLVPPVFANCYYAALWRRLLWVCCDLVLWEGGDRRGGHRPSKVGWVSSLPPARLTASVSFDFPVARPGRQVRVVPQDRRFSHGLRPAHGQRRPASYAHARERSRCPSPGSDRTLWKETAPEMLSQPIASI